MKNRIAGAQISGTWKLNSRIASSIGHKDYGYDKSAEATSFVFPNMAIGKKTDVREFAAGKFGDNQMNKAMLESILNSQEKHAAVWTHKHSSFLCQ